MTTIDKICEIMNQNHFLLPFKDTYVSDLPVAMLKFHTLTGKKKELIWVTVLKELESIKMGKNGIKSHQCRKVRMQILNHKLKAESGLKVR